MPARPSLVRLLAVSAYGTLLLAGGIAFFAGGSDARTSPPLAQPLLRVSSTLPVWRAPGAPLTVEGRARPGARVTLRAGARTLTSVRARAGGRFRLSVQAPAPGRYRLTVASQGLRRELGTLRVRPLVLAAVGDITFGADVGAAIEEHGSDYPWRSVAPVLRAADLATGNLETAVSTRGEPMDKEYTFRGPPSSLAAARAAGLDVLSVANNHSLDYGADAFADTLRAAAAESIATVGGGANVELARRPRFQEAGGLRLAFLGYSDVRPLGFDAGPTTPGTTPADPEAIALDVAAAAGRADVVVVWFHWGVERMTTPDQRQQELAAAAVSAGAAIVLGAHPHVLQPIGRPDEHRLVAWSLGNFVFGAHSPGTQRTGILLMRLDARGVRDYRLRPARIENARPLLEATAASP